MALFAPRSIYEPLIQHSIDLCRLYRRAATAAREPGLRSVLNENAQTLMLVVADLQAQQRRTGEPSRQRGTLRGTLRAQWAAGMPNNASRTDNDWIHALGQYEVRLLHLFERATIATAPADVALVLRRQLPRLHGIHLDMHGLGGTARH
ncbi:hypothetical protein ASD22_13670 [Rhodanobacter sp. Root480]|uniref:DUF2383 domain-containing protein n=1 Tax=Rhodanobacter ginsenosidimutans TaxID=490571 RepID=A0ABW0JXF6_9GAMM|nr:MULTISPECIES: DUF2383 domain-containing protein [unclassified Rhodanobacter]KQX96417.1 hypothetical protein ASD22_13670 [Rhodanobacter sp. Root480]KRA31722.1 hypothetical protein ASD68_13830 [Rhodanobacter sp. Root627]HUH54381.1 DUF2383 domain-containing protein [Rhodanobacter sp.]